MATVTEVATALEKLGLFTVVRPARGDTPAFINIYVADDTTRPPAATLWPPKPGYSWSWGDSYENGADEDADADVVAAQVKATIVPS